MYWFVTYMGQNGMSFRRMIDAWYVNASTTGLVWDLTISAVALTLWIVIDSRARRDALGLVAIPLIFAIGLACALPLYLFLRSRERR